MKCGSGNQNDIDTKSISRHEVMCTVDDVINISAKLLIPKGRFFMIHRPNRLVDIITCWSRAACPASIGGAGTIANPVAAAVLNKYVKDATFTDPEQSAFMSNIHMLKDDPNFEV